MTDKEKKRQLAYEALVIMGMLAFLTFICRLWPILLLIILGIFIAAIRLLFLSSKKVEVLTIPPIQDEIKKPPTEYDVRILAYSVILRRITELVTGRYPEARWVWENPNAMQLIELGEDVYILLNRAGGYRRAKVTIQNLQVVGFEFQKLPLPGPILEEPLMEKTREDKDEFSEDTTEEDAKQPENYELLAFEWVEANIFDLNERCNEAIGKGQTELILNKEQLPISESWPDICKELRRSELSDVECSAEGIIIKLMQ